MSAVGADAADPCGDRAVATDGFVVICDARSGSGFLSDGLNQHPQLACHHELFNPAFAGSLYGVEPFHRFAETDPPAYLADMCSRTRAASGADLVGFKLHYRHDAAVLDQVLADPRERIILLSRRDKLAQWASYRLATLTRQWSRPKDDADIHPLTRVPFSLRRFTVYSVHQRAWERHVMQRRPDALHVRYEDIIRLGGLRPVLRFLGVDPDVEISPITRRQFAGETRDERFTNPRWAAFGARIARLAARLVDLSGAAALVCRYTRY